MHLSRCDLPVPFSPIITLIPGENEISSRSNTVTDSKLTLLMGPLQARTGRSVTSAFHPRRCASDTSPALIVFVPPV